MSHPAPLRRIPVQQRSAERVERMLAGCAALIEELGYDGVTTTLIAERAGVAVGSLYQFFPDKRAVVQELTARNLEDYLRRVRGRAAQRPFENWREAVDAAFDVYVEMFRSVPAFGQIRFGDVVDVRLLDDQRDNNTVIAEAIVRMLQEHFGMAPDRLRLPVAVAVEITDGILELAFRRRCFDVNTVVGEARHAVWIYLDSRLSKN